MKDSWLDFQNDFADSLDPLHLDDELFGDGDGYTDFGEMMRASEDDHETTTNHSDEEDDCKDYCDEGGVLSPENRPGVEGASPAPPASGVTLTLSVAWPPRKAPTTGMWRYFNESPDFWRFGEALLDRFPELLPDYEGKDYVSLKDVISETYEIDKPRAIAYLRWIWANFPVEMFALHDGENDSRGAWVSRGEVLLRLIDHNPDDRELYDLMKSEEFLHAAFVECMIKKHDLDFPQRYISYLLQADDFDAAKRAYDLFLAAQKGRYGSLDLGKMWDTITFLNVRYGENMSVGTKRRLLVLLRPLVRAIGIRGEKVCKKIENYLAELKEGDE